MAAVLVADPDPGSRRRLAEVLRHFGYQVRTAPGPAGAAAALRRHPTDALILDPTGDDAEATIRALRPRTEIPILVVSAPTVEGQGIRLLDAGADDYLSKPYDPEELLARLRVALRRCPQPGDEPQINTPDFTIDLAAHRVSVPGGEEVRVTPTEWRLIEILARRHDRLVPQADLLASIRGAAGAGKNGYLRVYIASIRRKLEPDPSRPRYFLTVPGVGLRFVPDPPAHC